MISKSTIFYDVMPCCVVEVYRGYRGTDCLHLQGRRVSRLSEQQALYMRSLKKKFELNWKWPWVFTAETVHIVTVWVVTLYTVIGR
jgi:hypothetical protein